MIETNWNRDGLRLKNDNLRRGCRLQDGGAVQGQNESGWHVVAHRRGGREARLARGGIGEHSTACHLDSVDSVSLLLNHGNPTVKPVCVFLPFPLLPLIS